VRWRWIVINYTLFLVPSGADWSPRHHSSFEEKVQKLEAKKLQKLENTLFDLDTGAPKEELEGGSVAFSKDSPSQKVGN